MAELAPIVFEIPCEVERPRSRGRGAANTVVPIDRARPEWLKVRLPTGPTYENLRRLMRSKELHTVCEEAHCPNMAECWGVGTATFMILGDTCTRSCGFCAVKTGRPGIVDVDEPARVGEAVARMGLGHAVVTSVNRDELPDGGASLFADTIREIRRQSEGTTVEVLIPDFLGKPEALDAVIEAKPEVVATMCDIVARGTQVLTIGQSLRPSPMHLPIERYWTPAEFAELHDEGMALGFRHVESGPLVRSSYHAERHVGV